MVHGLEVFKTYFEAHTSQYVLIGGTACDILMEDLGVPFRVTKDLDMVIILEVLNRDFGEEFWRFITDGGYENREKSSGEAQFYRFSKPRLSEYPKMIELFSRKPDGMDLRFETGLTPIRIDDDLVSLSAILLDDAYYDCLLKGKRVVEGYSVINLETLILFKMKAWLDMKEKLENGGYVERHDIGKHRNDIFRLLANVSPDAKVEVSGEIEKDLRHFMDRIRDDEPDLKMLGIKGADFSEMMGLLKRMFKGKLG